MGSFLNHDHDDPPEAPGLSIIDAEGNSLPDLKFTYSHKELAIWNLKRSEFA